MPLSKGDRLGPYEILAPIGAGGMGEVFKATDTRLDRTVALKVSKSEFSERFEREARAISALNHPHICQLYDVGPNYLVMEYIEGAALKGPLPLDKALEYAGQIASALDAAHSKKITHRDLKPANILVTKSAGVKLLDFGLAKIGRPISMDTDATMTMGLTGQGTILGTLFYMSPEQIQGQESGPLSDIFSFGLVLYEMLTGKRAFDGATAASVMGAILERPAPSVTDVAPAALNRVLKRCLEKDPENRWQSARDLQAALELIGPEPSAVVVPAPARPLRSTGLHALALLSLIAVAAAIAVSVIHFRETPPVAEVRRFEIRPQEGQTFRGAFALSPDGKNLAYIAADAAGAPRIFVRPLNSLDAKAITNVATPGFSWSPDSRAIRVGGANARQVNIADGTVEPWSVPPEGDPTGNRRQHLLPDGKRVVFHQESGIYLQTSEGGGEPKLLKANIPQTNLDFSPIMGDGGAGGDGYLLFMLDSLLVAQRLDLKKLELTGDTITVVSGVARGGGGAGYFSASEDGTLVYRPGSRDRVSALLDRQGKVLETFPGSGSLALSPDATRAVVQTAVTSRGESSLLIVDLVRHSEEQFTFGATRSGSPVWSPDGTRIAFNYGPANSLNIPTKIYVKPANGSQAEELLYESSDGVYLNSWSRDEKYIVFSKRDPKTDSDLWIWNVAERKAAPFLPEPLDQLRGEISPDGRWIAYASNESGAGEVYVRSFPDGKGKWLVSRSGGDQPRWRRDGRELFFRRGGDLYTADITPTATFQSGSPKRLFAVTGPGPGQQNSYYDLSADGQRFLVTGFAPETVTGPITLVLNWQAGLKK